MTKKITNIFRMMVLGLSVADGLLVCEVIRRSMISQSTARTAQSLWGIGAALAFVCFVLKARSQAFSIISLVANVSYPRWERSSCGA